MRIAIVCSYYPWPPSIGGVETIVRNVSTELARRGHEVHVITIPFDVTTMKQVSNFGVEERDGVTVHKLMPGRLRVGYARFLRGLNDVIRKVEPEVVHSHNLHPHLFQLAKWKKRIKYKLVAELHHPIVNIDHLSAKFAFPILFRRFVSVQEAIDVIIAHTGLEERWLMSKGVDPEMVSRVRPAMIRSCLFSYKPKAMNMWSDNGRLLFVGRVVFKKGVHILIKALSKVKNANLVIAGPFDERYLKSLKTLTMKSKLEDRVKFMGPLAEGEKYDPMANCDIFTSPSLNDYHPITLIEAQSLGKPVISTTVGAIPEIVINGKTGVLVKPNDETELASALVTMLHDDKIRGCLSENAKEFAKLFAVESSVNVLESVYDKVLINDRGKKNIAIR